MKKLFLFLIVLLALVLTVISVSALGKNNDGGNIGSVNHLVIGKDGLPATLSVAALYAPNESYGMDYWRDLVCSGMTIGGCEYFESSQAPEMWKSQIGHAADFVNSVTKVKTIDGSFEVWKAHLTIFITAKEKVEHDVFILVERGGDGRWYLDRVLYGPDIHP